MNTPTFEPGETTPQAIADHCLAAIKQREEVLARSDKYPALCIEYQREIARWREREAYWRRQVTASPSGVPPSPAMR